MRAWSTSHAGYHENVDQLRAELHCHLDGVLDASLAAELGLDVELVPVRTLAGLAVIYCSRVAQIPQTA